MPTEQVEYKPSEEKKLSSLVINEVDSNETFEKMKKKGLLQDNQLYLVTDEQGSGSADFVIEQNKRLEQKFWRGTKAEFNAVETKSDDTMYIIVDDDVTIVEPGGMQPSVYDPQGIATDIFDYVDKRVSSIPTPDVSGQINAHNTNLDAHPDIRQSITGLTNRLNALADSDDTTLDQLSEIVAYIKNNKSLIDGITTSKINVNDIIDNLTTNDSNKPLSAAQGVALKALIDAIAVPTKTSELTNDSGYLTSFTETDPTVPGWAKAPDKPTYTASEVGAATMTEVNSAIQTAIGNAIGGSY